MASAKFIQVHDLGDDGTEYRCRKHEQDASACETASAVVEGCSTEYPGLTSPGLGVLLGHVDDRLTSPDPRNHRTF